MMAHDPYADFSLTANGADLSVVWLTKGGATISIGGDQPMDQPPCSITLPDEELISLAARIIAEASTITWASAAKRELRAQLIESVLADLFPPRRVDNEPERTPGWLP